MSKIKTRETVKNVKVIDKAAVAGARMKSAFIRSKDGTENLVNDRQITPSEYAEDKVMYATEEISHDATHLAGSGIKSAASKGKEVFQRRRAEKAAERQREHDLTSEEPISKQSPTAEAKNEHSTSQSSSLEKQIDSAAEQLKSTDEEWPLSSQTRPIRQGDQPVSAGDSDITLHSDTDRMVEQGQELAKKKAKQKAEVGRQFKQQSNKIAHQPERIVKSADIFSRSNHSGEPIRAVERPAQSVRKSVRGVKPSTCEGAQSATATKQTTHPPKQSVRTVEQFARPIKQTAKSTGNATSKTAIGTVKTSQRVVKTAQQTSKTAVKTAQATAKTAQKTAPATAKAARAASTVAKAVAAAGKDIIAGSKALIAAIAAGGWIVVLVTVIICLIALIVGSCYGIFWGNENVGDGQTLSAVLQEIDSEFNSQIETIKLSHVFDEVVITGDRADWNEILAVYAVFLTTDPNGPREVVSMDNFKKSILTEIFWKMNTISAWIETVPADKSYQLSDSQNTVKNILHIAIHHKTAEIVAGEYGFTPKQLQLLYSLLEADSFQF